MKKFVLFVLLSGILIGCKKTDPDPQPAVPKYFVISSNTQFGGHISTYQKGTIVSNAFSVPQGPTGDRIADATLSGDRIYAVRATSSKVDIVQAGDMTLVKTISFSSVSTGNYFKQIEYVNNKIVVADAAFLPNTSFDFGVFLKVIDPNTGKTDSIPVTKNNLIMAMGAFGNKLYVSLIREDQKRVIRVFDANFSMIKDIDMGTNFCAGIDFDKDGNLIAITPSNVVVINAVDLSITKTKLIGAVLINIFGSSFTNSRSYCVDKENNILYYLRSAPQPASAPFVFTSYNLATDEVKTLNTSFVSGSSIAYDASQKLVVIGDFPPIGTTGGTVKMYNVTGSLYSQFSVPTVPSEILIK
jgi:hypothetical protein